MAQPGSLQVPKPAGRSRFSKALPAIPPIDTSSPEMPSFPISAAPAPAPTPAPVSTPGSSNSKALPTPRTLQDLPPPPPPPHDDDPRVPIQFTPLPPLPKQKPASTTAAPTTPTSGPPKMMIPRRPVGSKQQPPQQPPKSEQAQVPPPQPQQQTQTQSQPQPIQQRQAQKEENQDKLQRGRSQEQEQEQTEPTPPVPSNSEPGPGPGPQRSSQPPQLPEVPLSSFQTLSAVGTGNQQPLKSPSESLSSLLSAYSRSSTASVVRSSDGTAYSAVGSHTNESPNCEAPIVRPEGKKSLSTIASAAEPEQTQAPRPAADASPAVSSPLPPPPPSKDDALRRPSSPSRPMNAGSDLATSSPPRQQIWRRRSLKGSRELPNLRLDHSHGSTASSSTSSTITATQKPQQQSTSSSSGLAQQPSTSTDDFAPKPAPESPAKDSPTMGSGNSKIQQLKSKFHAYRRSDESTKSAKKDKDTAPTPGVNRPPTPEYQKEDARTPVGSTFVSPHSPSPSPEPSNTIKPDVSKDLQAQPTAESSGSVAEPKPISRKAVPPTQAPEQALHAAKSLPDLKAKAPSPADEPLPPASAYPHPPSSRRSPSTDPAGPARGRQPGPPGAHPPSSRNTSARPDSRGSQRPGWQPRHSGPDGDPRWATSSSGDMLYRGRDGTLYPEMKSSGEPDPNAGRFPLSLDSNERAPPGTIFKPTALKVSHYNCYQRHKTVVRRPNRRYPLACQTCEKADTEDRWSCTFCNLRICESCLKSFEGKHRDLRALMGELSSSGALSLSSPTRPGSALGLGITAS